MATTSRELGFPIPAKLVETVLMGQGDSLQLQDFPILGDVWLAYAAQPAKVQDLLITPQREARAPAVAREISVRIESVKGWKRITPLRKVARREKGASIAYLQDIIAAQLYFDEILGIVVPMTRWWRDRAVETKLTTGTRYTEDLAVWLAELLASVAPEVAPSKKVKIRHEFTALDRYVALAGLILWASKQPRPKRTKAKQPTVVEICDKIKPHIKAITACLYDLFSEIKDVPKAGSEVLITQVSLNRRAAPALEKSVAAVKADAARKLFGVSCKDIAWAVLDSGIEANHPAFIGSDGQTRVKRSLDFTRVRDIVSSDTIENARSEELLEGISLNDSTAKKYLKS